MVYDRHIFICTNERAKNEKRSCGEGHGLMLVGEFKKRIKDLGLPVRIRTNRAGCLGICDHGPTIAIYPEGTFYVGVEKADVEEIIQSHIINNTIVERLEFRNGK